MLSKKYSCQSRPDQNNCRKTACEYRDNMCNGICTPA
jgi:hypothetical protein